MKHILRLERLPMSSELQTPDSKNVLRAAVSRGEITVYYQPQVSAETGALAGVECLVRWRHPERGFISPAEFLPAVADDEHIIQLLGETVLRQACEDAAAWPDIVIGVNISPVQFRLPELAGRIIAIAKEEGFPLNRLELEILESSYFENPAHMREVLTGLRVQGIRIALDDFGTGYSSLAALLELPLDKLKIDSGFVKKFDDLRGAPIIHSITTLALAIGLKVTAEGVETHAQQIFLRAAGCHFLQGYLFSEPVAADAITRMIASGKMWPCD